METELLRSYQTQLSEGLGEDFFLHRTRSLKDSIEEIGTWIEQRGEVSRFVLEEIEREKHEKSQRLETLSISYAAERVVLIQGLDSLCKERRAELIRNVQDTLLLRKETRQKIEEYEGMVQLFRGMSIQKSGPND